MPEARDAIGIGADAGGQDLDCCFAVECDVASKPDLAHSATAEKGDDLIGVQACAGSDVHGHNATAVRMPRASLAAGAYPNRIAPVTAGGDSR